MTIASEIDRLQCAKADICTAIENKWVIVWNITLDNYADCIDAIQTDWRPSIDFLLIWWGWWWGINWGGNYSNFYWGWWGWAWWVVEWCWAKLEDWCYNIVIWGWWFPCGNLSPQYINWWNSCFWDIVACWWWGWGSQTPGYAWCNWGSWWWWPGFINGWSYMCWWAWCVGQWYNGWKWCYICFWYRCNKWAWWWGWWAGWAWCDWVLDTWNNCGKWWDGWIWIMSDIEWEMKCYAGWWWGWAGAEGNFIPWCNWGGLYWSWWNAWTAWCKWVFIIRYPSSCWYNIFGWDCCYECNWKCIHIFTQDWTLTVN